MNIGCLNLVMWIVYIISRSEYSMSLHLDDQTQGNIGFKMLDEYCYENHFRKKFSTKDRPLTTDALRHLVRYCKRLFEKKPMCRTEHMYPYLTFHNSSVMYAVGAINAKAKERVNNCWMYYLSATSKRTNKVVFHRYFTDRSPGYQHGAIRFENKFLPEDYGDELSLTLTAFPDGDLVVIGKRFLPKNECQKKVRVKTVEIFWKYFYIQGDCRTHYIEENMQVIAEQFCDFYNNNADPNFIKRTLPRSLSVKYCIVSFQKPEDVIIIHGRYVWITTSIILVLVISSTSYKCYLTRKKRDPIIEIEAKERILIPPNGMKVILPKDLTGRLRDYLESVHPPDYVFYLWSDSEISVIILHRPGCDHLDNFIRDLAFVIHSYGINVKSPLLELSHIDAEGGIATYIQRNINICTYVIVVVTESQQEDFKHYNHKPFEFSLKMLRGLSFRENECERYIPVYIEEYKSILKSIPPFLTASRNCGFQVPYRIKDLIKFMKQTDTLLPTCKDIESKIDFFTEKLKIHSTQILKEKHENCYQGLCIKGIIPENITELWPGTSTVYSHDTLEDIGQSITNLTEDIVELPETHLDTPTNLDQKVENWRLHSSKLYQSENSIADVSYFIPSSKEQMYHMSSHSNQNPLLVSQTEQRYLTLHNENACYMAPTEHVSLITSYLCLEENETTEI